MSEKNNHDTFSRKNLLVLAVVIVITIGISG